MKPALLLVDVQANQFAAPHAVAGGPALLGRLEGLLARARSQGAPVILVRNCGGPEDPDVKGTPGWELVEAVRARPGEPVLDKTTCDTFQSTALDDELKSRGVRSLVIAGLQSDWCIRETTLGALARGYDVTLVADGHSTLPGATRAAAEISAAVNAELAPRVRLASAADVEFAAPAAPE